LLLRKWPDLDLLNRTEPKPFARFLTPRGYLSDSWRNLKL